MKKRNHQQKVELRKKVTPIILFGFILSVFVYISVFNCVALYHFKNNELNHYTGTYSFQQLGGGKHSRPYFLFVLDNGDMVYVPCADVEYREKMSESSELTFVYTKMSPPGRFPWVFDCASIVSQDGDVIVDIEKSIDGYRDGLKSTLITLGVSLVVFAAVYFIYRFIKKKFKF